MKTITWKDCLIAADKWLESIKVLIDNYPEDKALYQQELEAALAKIQELSLLAEEEMKQHEKHHMG
jgi:ABC-type Zn uptake system ZnuABC Zn-binding protein ZnuA